MTTPTDVAVLLRALEAMPVDLQAAAGEMSEAAARTPPANGAFSLVEQAWHLADLEREGYGERIRRLLAERGPELPDFDESIILVGKPYDMFQLAEQIARILEGRGRPPETNDAAI